jgi:hypothetical protein
MLNRRRIETMNDLSAAMKRVDAIGGAGLDFVQDRPAPLRPRLPHPVRPDSNSVEAEAILRASLVAERRADALRVVSRAIDAKGHDLTSWRPADATMAWSIAKMLIEVMDAEEVDLPPPYHAASASVDLACAAAVAKAIGEEGV